MSSIERSSFAVRASMAWAIAWLIGAVLVVGSTRAWAEPARDVPLADSVLRAAAKKRFSAEELARHDGSDPKRPILIAVRGIVFDVSEGGRFYATGSRYQALAGRDSSRAVARMSLDAEDLTDDCSSLTDAEWDFLGRVLHETYLAKYPVLGHLRGGAFYPEGLCCQKEACGPC